MKEDIKTEEQIADPKRRAALRKFGQGLGLGAGALIVTSLDARRASAAPSSSACGSPPCGKNK